MFTGIVEEMGVLAAVEPTKKGRRFRIAADKVAGGLEIGDSVAVNGVCLTVTEAFGDGFSVEAVAETLARSNLGEVATDDRVNLERPLRADGRFDGHIVQGHVDGTGTITSIQQEGESLRLGVAAEPSLLRYIVEKGSITVDGVSLTVTAVGDAKFEFVLIPHTLEVTIFGTSRIGDMVNLEVDVLAKYVEKMMGDGR